MRRIWRFRPSEIVIDNHASDTDFRTRIGGFTVVLATGVGVHEPEPLHIQFNRPTRIKIERYRNLPGDGLSFQRDLPVLLRRL